MKNFTDIMNDADPCFNPFYDENVVVELKGGERVTVKACVTTDNTVDPLSDDMVDTESQGITLTFRAQDWPILGNIKRGDKVTRTLWNGQLKNYSVGQVKEDWALGFLVVAREV